MVLEKVAELLAAQGGFCLNCPESSLQLYPLPGDCEGMVEGAGMDGVPAHFGVTVFCHQIVPLYRFELSMTPLPAACGKGVCSMPKNQTEHSVAEDPRYHDTWRLLKKYRDVVWSLEVTVQQPPQ